MKRSHIAYMALGYLIGRYPRRWFWHCVYLLLIILSFYFGTCLPEIKASLLTMVVGEKLP